MPNPTHTFTSGRYTLEWVDLGEGYDGEYDPEDPEDRPVLRADLYGDGEAIDGGSYCTLATVTTPDYVLDRLSRELLAKLPADPSEFRRATMAAWTWATRV